MEIKTLFCFFLKEIRANQQKYQIATDVDVDIHQIADRCYEELGQPIDILKIRELLIDLAYDYRLIELREIEVARGVYYIRYGLTEKGYKYAQSLRKKLSV